MDLMNRAAMRAQERIYLKHLEVGLALGKFSINISELLSKNAFM